MAHHSFAGIIFSITISNTSEKRSMMQGYVVGIKATDGTGFQQKTILRMMINGMHTLLHDKEIADWGVNPDLDDIYRIVSKDAENYETLINEMNQAYEDLANT